MLKGSDRMRVVLSVRSRAGRCQQFANMSLPTLYYCLPKLLSTDKKMENVIYGKEKQGNALNRGNGMKCWRFIPKVLKTK